MLLAIASLAAANRRVAQSSTGGGVPSYISGLSDYQVSRLTSASNGNVSLADTLPSAWVGATGVGNNNNIMAAYSGGCSDSTNKRLFVHGGGHSDSAYNGLHHYDYNGTTQPTGWVRTADPTAPGSIAADTDPQSNGAPVSIHTYAGMVYDPTTNRVFRYQGSQWSSGSTPTKQWYYDLDDASWAQSPNMSGSQPNPVASVISITDRKILVVSHNGDWWFHRIDTNARGGSGSDAQQAFDAVAAYDTSRSRAIVQAPGEFYLLTIDWSAETVAWSQPSVSGSTGAISNRGPCIFYDAAMDRFWLLPLTDGTTSMGAIYEIHPTTWAITSHTTSGSTSGYTTNGWSGSYNKYCWMPEWRAVGFVTGISDAAYVLKLPAA